MKRKLLSVMLGAAMAATLLAGCGGSSAPATTAAATKAAAAATTAAPAAAATTKAAVTTVTSAAAAATTAAAGAKSDKLTTVGFVQVGHESDWRTASTKSVQAAFSKDKGFDLQFVDCDNDSKKQIDAVRNFIQQDVDYIVIDPIVATGWDTVLTEAETAKIPVIVIDRTIDDSDKYVAWIGTETKNEGLASGAWLESYAAKKGIKELNILIIEGTTGSSAQIGRSTGFMQYADKNKWTVLDHQTGDFTQDGGQKVMESFCKSYAGKFNVVVCQNDNEAFGAMDAMKAAGVKYGVNGDVIVISYDACKAGLQKTMDGEINADFQCNPLQGPDCAKIVADLAAGKTVEKKTFMAEPWYVNEDILPEVKYTNAAGKEVSEKLIKVTKDIVDAGY
jgi:ABC-type sugar transport system substrate-binding protein